MVDKYLALSSTGQQIQKTPLQVSSGAASAGQIAVLGSNGKFDPSMYNPGADSSRPVVASETIGAGKFVNYHLVAGALNCRLADNSNNRAAHGFSIAGGAAAASVTVYDLDAVNSALTGLTIASDYFLGTAGTAVTPSPDPTTAATGTLIQKLGLALSATELDTDDYPVFVA